MQFKKKGGTGNIIYSKNNNTNINFNVYNLLIILILGYI